MKNVSYRYSVCHADRVTLDVGETLTFPRGSAARSLGVLLLQGRLESTEIETGDVLLREPEPIGFMKRFSGTSPISVFAPDGAEWFCLSRNDSGDREVACQTIDGAFTLAAGWGLIVAQGRVVIDGIEVAQDRYFKPRLTDLTGAGAGIILLVR